MGENNAARDGDVQVGEESQINHSASTPVTPSCKKKFLQEGRAARWNGQSSGRGELRREVFVSSPVHSHFEHLPIGTALVPTAPLHAQLHEEERWPCRGRPWV